MANPNRLRQPSLGGSSVPPSPVSARQRRDSTTSLSVSSHVDKEQLALALDKIHTSASQSGALTTFNDFAPPPGSLPSSESKATAGDLVQQGLSGLYTRLKEAVGAVGKPSGQEVDDASSQDGASRKNAGTDVPTSGMSSMGVTTGESQSNAPQSSKASSITTASASKTSARSIQNLPKIAKTPAPTTANAAIAPVTVQGLMDRDAARGTTIRVEGLPGRSAARRSISRPAGSVTSPSLATNASLESIAISDRMVLPNRAKKEDARSMDGIAETPRSPSQSLAEHNERPQMLRSGIMRIPGTTTNEGAPEMVNARLERMRKQVMSKEFWMADETCKECFLCGIPFTAFRRKHHCRTCGCIFDAKCTSNISGQKFGVPGTLRVCKTCLNVINRRYDSGSDDSADESYLPAIFRANQPKAVSVLPIKPRTDDEASMSERTEQADDTRTVTTPMMAIPATRRVGDGNRHSAVLEIDMPQLSRPGSSRSLKSLSANSKSRQKRAPFRTPAGDEAAKKPNVNAFHADNIIDPELADYMSDESSDDEQMSSIFATIDSGDVQPASLDPGRSSFGPYLSAGRKHRFRQGDKSPTPLSNFESPVETLGLRRSDSIRDGTPSEECLNPASMQHVKKLFRQLLADANIPNPTSWERSLLPILDRCADDVDPDTRNGDDMDIRHWVKFKKIPGGRPGDTAYVHGVVFTKNLALKSMPRKIRNPRIVIITFPLEYQRHPEQHFMSLQPVIEQEREFLRMVVNRILNLEPHVLLVQKSVAGVALQYLSEANVAVAYNVKPSVIEAVARIVNMPVISSMDMLSLGARVGVSESFEVKTFVNNEIKGRKKTYIFISGCPKDRGCTIALRGASTETLSHMKRITEFMVYVVYNLKLESCLMRDEFVQIPAENSPSAPPSLPSSNHTNGNLSEPCDAPPDLSSSRPAILVTHQSTGSEKILQQPGDPTAIFGSEAPCAEQHTTDSTQGSASLPEPHHHIQVPDDAPKALFYSDMVVKYETRILSASPFVKFTQPYLLMRAREQERRAAYLKSLLLQDKLLLLAENKKGQAEPFQLVKLDNVRDADQMAPRKVIEVVHALHEAEYDKALHNFRMQAKQWETDIYGSLDPFDPYAHQNIVVLYSLTCTETKIPCTEPHLAIIEFYNEHPYLSVDSMEDCTIGQYIEELCENADLVCHANGCDRRLHEHHRTYVHDNARLTIILETFPAWPDNFPDKPQERDGDSDGTGICMWNYCKHCKKHFGLMPMSVSTWKYSFGKYLELSFWGRGLRLNPQTECPHDHQKDHIRFFYYLYRDMAVRVHYDPIDLYEIIVPRTKVTWKVEQDLKLKNDIFIRVEERWNRFMNSVVARLRSIRIDSVLPEKAEECKAEVERLSQKAQEDQPELIHALQEAYMRSSYHELIPLNTVIREMLEKVTEWDAAFANFEADFLSDKDVRQLTIIQLKKMFTDHESKESLTSTDGTTSLAESEEKTTPATSPPGTSEVDEKLSQTLYGDNSQPRETPTTPTTQPVPIHKAEGAATEAEGLLERVEPLDLATPSSPCLTKNILPVPEGGLEPVKPPNDQPGGSAPGTSSTVSLAEQAAAAPSLVSGHLSLTEKIEQLRREQRTLSNDVTGGESIADGSRSGVERTLPRRVGAAVSPPMVRAISQPAGTLPRTQSAIGKLLKEQRIQDMTAEAQKVSADGTLKGDKKFPDRIGLATLKGHRKAGSSGIPRYVHKRESKVSTLARHFEQLSREFEKERLKDRKQRAAKMHHTRAFLPRSSTKTIVEVYKDVDQAVQEPGPTDDDQLLERERAERSAGQPSRTPSAAPTESQQTKPLGSETGLLQEPQSQDSHPTEGSTQLVTEENRLESRVGSDDEGAESDVDNAAITLDDILPGVKEIADSLEPSEEIPEELPKHQKKSLMTMLTNFWAERSASGWPQLEYPINATDHIFFDSDVIIKEDEPSSLVAFALSSEDYRSKLAEIRQRWEVPSRPDPDDSSDGLEMKPLHASDPVSAKTPQVSSKYDMELEKSLLRSTAMHVKYQFVEGSAKMMCQIFYAEQFDALRRKCGVADRFVDSLSRCLKWDSKGGKTKSVFLKTLDERFILKSLSPSETSSFLKFAPDYFSIMGEALFRDLPSVIAKMFGFFRVFIKNPLTNTEIKLDLLVMENLFYDRCPSRTFDLKGSMRNRKIQSTGDQNEVLLDENMVEYIYESPLFAREHSKRTLKSSVFNDTLFLAKQDVMDYSLMVAVDEIKKEISVGIIDCIRTYTWDKQLESWIKNRGFAGGGRNRPTVTSPREYKSRFREAMTRYILESPNCWPRFEDDV
ncbi:Mitochondrial distribution and morphology protein 12 [Collariella sp. IMI 366227]|nr:Mitochondrial distribution and morphology protein 12 [Collariella sp. IMI 366227]